MKHVSAILLAIGLAAVSVMAQSSPAGSQTGAAETTWKVPRTADGRPDLQGVWANNSVTPMTRPTQWKDKDSSHRRRGRGAQEAGRAVRRPGRRRHLRQLHPDRAEPEGLREVQPGLLRPEHRQLQPVLDGRSRLGQPDVAHHRSAERPDAADDAGGTGATRRAAAAGGPVSSRARRAGRGVAPMVRKIARFRRALHLVRRAADRHRLQQLPADRAVARDGRHPAGDDSRRARRPAERAAAPADRTSGSFTAIRAAAGKATRWSSRRRTSPTDSRDRRRT